MREIKGPVNVLDEILDKNTGEAVNYREITTHHTGVPMTDTLAKGVIYRKKAGKYYKRVFEGSADLEWFKDPLETDHALALARALQESDNVKITGKDHTIATAVTIPKGTRLEIKKGVILKGAGKLVVKGRLDAGAYQIADSTFALEIHPSSSGGVVYPEWFGAVPMSNPRDSAFSADTINSTAAFKRLIEVGETSSYVDHTYPMEVRLSGFYAIDDTLILERKSYRFVGYSQSFEGAGFRWIGNAAAGKSILRFIGSDFGGVENCTFIAPKTSDDTLRLRSAIEVDINGVLGYNTQRGLTFRNINVGDMVGYYINSGTGFSFDHGIYEVNTGGANNDFFIIDNYRCWNAKVGIRRGADQSVDWRINSYIFGEGNIMYQSDKGGSFTGNTWYAAQSTYEGVIYCPSDGSRELRFQIDNMSSEHLKCKYFLYSDAKVKMKITTGFLGFHGLDKDGIAIPKTALVKGGCFTLDSEFEFERIRFLANNGTKLTFEQLGTGVAKRSLRLTQCSDIDTAGYFDFGANTTSQDITLLEYSGGKQVNPSTDYPKMLKTAIIKSSHPKRTSGLLWLKDVLDYTQELPFERLEIGTTGKGTTAGLTVRTRRATTVLGFVNRIIGALPAKAHILGVSAWSTASVLTNSGLHYVTVGTAHNEELFGRIAGQNANTLNTKPACNVVQNTAGDIVFKCFKYWASRTFTQSGTTITVDQAFFDADMAGGEFRWETGDLAGTVNKIVTVAADRLSVTVEASASGSGKAVVQSKMNAKTLGITVSYLDFGNNLGQNGADYLNSAPLETVDQTTGTATFTQLDTAGLEWEGSVNPEGVVTARKGATYRLTNAAGNTLYVKESSGLVNTGWKVMKDLTTGSPTTINKLWKGTQAQYDAIATKDANTLYFIE